MNPWEQFCKKWGNGCGSEYCKGAANVVLSRGQLPCDILLIGEGPGHSENTCGKPFVDTAPAGRLMQHMIDTTVPPTMRYALTNLVGCIPLEVDDSGTLKKVAQPSVDQVEKCAPRLQEFVALANPRLIVCVGQLARDWLDPKLSGYIPLYTPLFPRGCGKGIPMVDILHPSYMCRQKLSTKESLTDKAIVTIHQAIQEYLVENREVAEHIPYVPSGKRPVKQQCRQLEYEEDDTDIPF